MRGALQKFFLIAFLTALTLLSAYLGIKLHRNSVVDKKIKTDYFIVNQIKYGMLSGNNWSYQVNKIIEQKIDSFAFKGESREVLSKQINGLLERMLQEANTVLHKKRKGFREKVKYNLINAFVDLEDFRVEIPRFSAAIIDQLDKTKNKEQIKVMLKDKITGILAVTDQDTTGEKARILKNYGQKNLFAFNNHIEYYTGVIHNEQNTLGYSLIGILVIVLLFWIYILRIRRYYGLTFIYSVIISFSALFTGISLPMIEIDARISEIDLELLSSHIVFYDQVIFYQAKSIYDVISILIRNGKADMVFVGVLLFTFSVVFPVTKLICTTIIIYTPGKNNRFVNYMAFNSAKWSMADVMVIAIFMAYIGFKGILDDQLDGITVHSDTINVVTTNKTSLQTGFIIFVAFCLFNLFLAAILKKIASSRGQA